MTNELKDCPFCGSKPTYDYTDHHHEEWFKCWSDTDCAIRGFRMTKSEWQSRAPVPQQDGYVLVPREATEDMLSKTHEEMNNLRKSKGVEKLRVGPEFLYRNVWKAMIAAAEDAKGGG